MKFVGIAGGLLTCLGRDSVLTCNDMVSQLAQWHLSNCRIAWCVLVFCSAQMASSDGTLLPPAVCDESDNGEDPLPDLTHSEDNFSRRTLKMMEVTMFAKFAFAPTSGASTASQQMICKT